MHEEIYNRCDPEPGNILYIKDGATTGIVTINDLNEQFSMLSSVALLKNPSKIYNRYLLYVLKSPYFYSLMRDDMSGVAITRITLTKLNKALIPLAPFEEQKRIVAKVEKLMILCDELETGLMQAQTEGGELMEAVMHQLCRNSQS
ncbi:MAG: EcoKI restriction-modification system protein HsdS [ANME-2 cluster archaeon HR1]|nr:MAG: EcoKI restriction-modification system protein HsdS [ANME-2 cluster archaeon HR1]